MQFQLQYKRFGGHSILIEWPNIIDENILDDVLNFKLKLEQSNIKKVLQISNAYNSILVNYENIFTNIDARVKELQAIYTLKTELIRKESRLWKIPVCYDDSFGIDLEYIASEKKISKSDIVRLHSQNIYTVYFIGFLPGFLYLGGLNTVLSTLRKSSPRLKINKGSVAIGGEQTGVYPMESPGGWNIIGNSPIIFFNAQSTTPCFAKAGDKVQFYPISLKEYRDIKTLVDANVYIIEEEL